MAIIMLGITFYLFINHTTFNAFFGNNQNNVIPATITQYVFIVVFGFAILTRLYDVLKLRKTHKLSLRASYIKILKDRKPFYVNGRKPFRNPKIIGIIFLVISAPFIPYLLAQYNAKNATSFTSIELSSMNTPVNIKRLVILRTEDGFVVKKYNTDKASFENGFEIVKEATKFSEYTIKR